MAASGNKWRSRESIVALRRPHRGCAPPPPRMIVFVSDMHFGRGARAQERESEAELVACLEAHAAQIEHLYLVGDVFDEYIEYRRLIPKGFVRFLSLLAQWTDRQVPVTYIVGNHDPWHRDYFETDLGVHVEFDHVSRPAGAEILYVRHGDGIRGLSRMLNPVLRHPLPVWLYRAMFPADLGVAVAAWVNKRLDARNNDGETAQCLRDHARRILAETPSSVVVMGHSHKEELQSWPDGVYLNTGSWCEGRTFGTLDAGHMRLLRWNGDRRVIVKECRM